MSYYSDNKMKLCVMGWRCCTCKRGKHIHFFLFWYQDHAFFINNLTNDCTIISNTIITNNMLLHVSAFQISSSGSSLCLAKSTYRFSGLSKRKLLKYRVFQEECEILLESVPYVKLYRYNPKHLYPKLNGYGDNVKRSLKL